MCQITAYLDDEKIMENVMFVEPTPNGIVLSTMFEEPLEVSATIRKIDLLKNVLYLENIPKEGVKNGGKFRERKRKNCSIYYVFGI